MLNEESLGRAKRLRKWTNEAVWATTTERNPAFDPSLASTVRSLAVAVLMRLTAKARSSLWQRYATVLKSAGRAPPLASLPVTPLYLVLGHLTSATVGNGGGLRYQMVGDVLWDKVLTPATRVEVVPLAVEFNRWVASLMAFGNMSAPIAATG